MDKKNSQELINIIRELEQKIFKQEKTQAELLANEKIIKEQNRNLVKKAIELSYIRREFEDKNFELESFRTELKKQNFKIIKKSIELSFAMRQIEDKNYDLQKSEADMVGLLEELRESEKRFKDFANMLPEVVFEVDLLGNFTYINLEALNMFGYNQNEFENGINAFQTFIPEDGKRLEEFQKEIIYSKKTVSIELTALKKDGNTFPILVYSNSKLQDGQIEGFRGVAIDISERQLAEEALLQSEEKLSIIINNIQDVIFQLTPLGFIQYVSPNVKELYGYKPEELIGKHLKKTTPVGEVPKALEIVKRVISGKEIRSFEINQLDSKGKIIPMEINIVPMKKGSKIVAVQGIMRDITERKKVEEEKGKLQEQYIQIQKMESVGRLAGGIAHDFNNILSIIMGYSELLKLRFVDTTKSEGHAAEAISKNSKRAAELVSQLLGFARGGRYNPVPIHMNSFIMDTLNIMEKVFEKKVNILYKFNNDIRACIADKSQLDQVLSNLILNAKDAMPLGGELTFETDNVYLDEEFVKSIPDLQIGNYVQTSISDNGNGIPSMIIDKIFEPFFTTKGVGEGTGFGLATTYGIIKNHKGHIEVFSEQSKGTRFTFYLPVSDDEVEIKNIMPTLIKGTETIFIIDDEEGVREILNQQLSNLGYNIISACDGMEAIKIFKKFDGRIDLVLLDMIMPNLAGRETFYELRKLNPEIPVLLMSGYSKDENALEILNKGAIDFLQKPIELNTLSIAIAKNIKKAL